MRFSDIKNDPRSYTEAGTTSTGALFRIYLLRNLHAIAAELDAISYLLRKKQRAPRSPKGVEEGRRTRRASRNKGQR